MKRVLYAGAAMLSLGSSLVWAQGRPESLLPPGFENPAPTPSPSPAPRATPTPSQSSAPTPAPTSSAVVQPLPDAASGSSAPSAPPVSLPSDLPSISELESLSTDELDELLGLKPKFDIPPAAQRSTMEIGLLSTQEGGLPLASLGRQPASLVRAALAGTTQPLVSRWGHIMLRRALASRLNPPEGMDPVEFAALRVAALNAMGEYAVARAVVQDIDTANWNEALTREAFRSYLATSDIVGICPAVQVSGVSLETTEWDMTESICAAFSGQGSRAGRELSRMLSRGEADPIDVLLAQRYAGAGGSGRRAVNLEWDDVDELTPWRFALANAVGAEIPESLRDNAGSYFQRASATAPMLPLAQRMDGAERAASEGILSSRAMVGLYSRFYALDAEGDYARIASRLRQAYVGADPAARLAAIRDVWGGPNPDYGRLVLTAYAAARLDPDSAFVDDAPTLIAAMLTAGLDRDAMRWADELSNGSQGWALLALAQTSPQGSVSSGQFDDFVDEDSSAAQRKSKFLLAGLAGLERLDEGTVADFSDSLRADLFRRSKWSDLIDRAAAANNPALVAMLAGVGMQGEGWERMTARHLYHIVAALNRVGMEAEARMIAAEAVARG